MNLTISLEPEEIELIRKKVVESLISELVQINSDAFQKRAYTVAEVAQQISYSTKSVSSFIREGRTARNGKVYRLPAIEVTTGSFRILPQDLDNWLSRF